MSIKNLQKKNKNLLDFDSTLTRIKEILDLKGASDAEIARQIGVKRQSLRTYKEKGYFPTNRIVRFCLTNGLPFESFIPVELAKKDIKTYQESKHDPDKPLMQTNKEIGTMWDDCIQRIMKHGDEEEKKTMRAATAMLLGATASIDARLARHRTKKSAG